MHIKQCQPLDSTLKQWVHEFACPKGKCRSVREVHPHIRPLGLCLNLASPVIILVEMNISPPVSHSSSGLDNAKFWTNLIMPHLGFEL